MLKYFVTLIACTLVALSVKTQATFNFESGIYFLKIEDVSDGGQGDIISYPDDFGITQLPNIRVGMKFKINRHIIYGKAVIVQFSKTAELKEPREYQGYQFKAGVPIKLDYKFNGYRIGYSFQFLEREKVEAGVGLTLNIRQGLIRFEDAYETKGYSKDPVPLVPLINYFTYFSPTHWFGLNSEFEFFYFTANGWVFDMLLAADFKPAKWISLYAGYRGFGGNGYSEGKFGNRLWANTVAVGINFIIP